MQAFSAGFDTTQGPILTWEHTGTADVFSASYFCKRDISFQIFSKACCNCSTFYQPSQHRFQIITGFPFDYLLHFTHQGPTGWIPKIVRARIQFVQNIKKKQLEKCFLKVEAVSEGD